MDPSELRGLLFERLTYDAERGALYRKHTGSGLRAGQRVGAHTHGKRQAEFAAKRYQVDALIWLWETGALPRRSLRHLNGDNLDDRFSNLAEGRAPTGAPDRERLAASFLAKAAAKFGGQHDYSAVLYVNTMTPVSIGCPEHGAFSRAPGGYLASSHGCPVCCHKAATAALRKTPEERLATRRAYVTRRADIYRKASLKHREKLRRENPEKFQARLAAEKAFLREWIKTPTGREHVRLRTAKRRARLRGALTIGVSKAAWRAICARYTNSSGHVCCAYCGQACDPPTMDHVVAIAAGGKHEPSNVVPACGPCNSSKCARPLTEWLASKAMHPGQ